MDSIAAEVIESSRMQDLVRVSGFEELYRLEYPGLLAVATAMTADRRDGEDAVQDTMVKTFVHWRRVSRLDRPGAWCHRVLVNACRSRLRRRAVERRYFSRLRHEEPTVSGPSAEALEFWELVRGLPDRPRAVVTLFYAGDRPIGEIAEILSCPIGTVRSDLSRARLLLAERLGY